MRKLLVPILAVASTVTLAAGDVSNFQGFDNEINIGFGLNSTSANQGTLGAGSGDAYSSGGSQLTLEGERLFNNGIWVDAIANMQFGGGPTTPGLGVGPVVTLNPYVAPSYGLNTKVGYAFAMANKSLLLTPYGMLGINNSQNSAVSDILSQTPGNSANSYYYTAGIGGRIEYIPAKWLELYADQNATYNWDQSNPGGSPLISGLAPQDFASYTSTLGAKFNVGSSIQLGIKGWYTDYTYASGSNAIPGGGTLAQATSGFGGLVSFGLVY